MPKWGSGGGLHLVFLVLDSICPSTVAFKCPAFIKVKKYAAKVDLFSTVASLLGLLFPVWIYLDLEESKNEKQNMGREYHLQAKRECIVLG